MFTKSYKLGIYSILEVIRILLHEHISKSRFWVQKEKKRVLQRNERPWHYWYGPVKGHLSHSPQPHDMQEDDYSIYEEMGVFVSQVMHSSDVKSEKVPFYVFPKSLLPPC